MLIEHKYINMMKIKCVFLPKKSQQRIKSEKQKHKHTHTHTKRAHTRKTQL
jgi:hypothetical protein